MRSSNATKRLDSRWAREPRNLSRVCRFKCDIGRKVAALTVRRVCDSHGIDDSASFANALEEDVTPERQAKVAAHPQNRGGCLTEFKLLKVAHRNLYVDSGRAGISELISSDI